MEDFIVIGKDGAAFKCQPQLIKHISEGVLSQYANKKNIAGRLSKNILRIDHSRVSNTVEENFLASLPGIPFSRSIQFASFIENGNRIIFTKLNQLLFAGEFRINSKESGKISIAPFMESNDEIAFETTLGWDTKALKEKTGVKVSFVAYMVCPENGMHVYQDSGGFLHRPKVTETGSTSTNPASSEFSSLFVHSNSFTSSDIPKLYLAMIVDGAPFASFPLLPNVFDDGKVCLGAYYMPDGVTGSHATPEQMFCYCITGFLFSSYNRDLLTAAGAVNASSSSYKSKTDAMRRLWSWDADTLEYSPSITREELLDFANDHVHRKYYLDLIISVMKELKGEGQ